MVGVGGSDPPGPQQQRGNLAAAMTLQQSLDPRPPRGGRRRALQSTVRSKNSFDPALLQVLCPSRVPFLPCRPGVRPSVTAMRRGVTWRVDGDVPTEIDHYLICGLLCQRVGGGAAGAAAGTAAPRTSATTNRVRLAHRVADVRPSRLCALSACATLRSSRLLPSRSASILYQAFSSRPSPGFSHGVCGVSAAGGGGRGGSRTQARVPIW